MSITLDNPYRATEGAGTWVRGNLHTHSTRSDGKREPQAVIDAYAAMGYQFLALSDHDTLADFRGLDPRGMALIPANEVSIGGCHILHLGANTRVEPDPNRQRVIDAISSAGGLAILNHPNWESDFDHAPYPTLLALKGYAGIEIFNGGCLTSPGSAFALDKWDRLLSAGRTVWGLANDDSHAVCDDGLGWNVVFVAGGSVTAAAILEALRAGCFYASTGVTISKIQLRETDLRVVAPDAEALEVVGEHGARLAWSEGSELVFDAAGVNGGYIRVQAYGRAGRAAWTQPFTVHGSHLDRMRALVEQRPVLKVLRVERAPELTGSAEGPQWRTAKASGDFFRMGDASQPSVATSVRCLCTDTALHIAVRCEEPFMDRVKATVQKDGSPALWTDDSIEIFLDVEGKGARYYHILANTLGHWCVARNTGLAKDVQCQCRVKREAAAWSVEFALNLDSLGHEARARSVPGSRWGFHVCRNRQTADESYVWAWVGNSNHTPERFGWLEF